MKRWTLAPLTAAVMALAAHGAQASTAYGDLNNFDAFNDTGQECHGFEIEIDDLRSTDISYTYDWNHYGPPKITESTNAQGQPMVTVRYESAKDANGNWAAYTAVPSAPPSPTDGHMCTNPDVNIGCEHFGVGLLGAPTAIRYNWLVDSGGVLVLGPAVAVATPVWNYSPPGPDPVVQPAQVVAAIPAPDLEIPADRDFSEPVWMKVIKTTSHNVNPVALDELVSADTDDDGLADWQNQEPDETETEWKLMQNQRDGGDGLDGLADDMGDGEEVVTRRYEFYKYNDPNAIGSGSIDGENGEAMCDAVAGDGIHGVGTVTVTDPNGDPYDFDCGALAVVGDYIGAQMAGFDASAPLGLIDHLQDADPNVPYTPRTVVVGGNSPYQINVPLDSLPPGMTLGDYQEDPGSPVVPGVLSGTPTTNGTYNFTVEVSDADDTTVIRAYTLQVGAPAPQQYDLSVSSGGSGSGSVAATIGGSAVACGASCTITRDAGTTVELGATPDTGSQFGGWSGACTNASGSCTVTLDAARSVFAAFDKIRYTLSVGKTGGGTGTVSGNGIDCGGTCSVQLDVGTPVSLTAAADAGSVFTGWSGACSGIGTCNTTISGETTVTASFVPATTQYTLSVATSGSGTVSSSPKGINCGKKCSTSFGAGTSVTLTAKPAKKHVFVGWSGACSGSASTCSVPMNSAQSVSASFN